MNVQRTLSTSDLVQLDAPEGQHGGFSIYDVANNLEQQDEEDPFSTNPMEPEEQAALISTNISAATGVATWTTSLVTPDLANPSEFFPSRQESGVMLPPSETSTIPTNSSSPANRVFPAIASLIQQEENAHGGDAKRRRESPFRYSISVHPQKIK